MHGACACADVNPAPTTATASNLANFCLCFRNCACKRLSSESSIRHSFRCPQVLRLTGPCKRLQASRGAEVAAPQKLEQASSAATQQTEEELLQAVDPPSSIPDKEQVSPGLPQVLFCISNTLPAEVCLATSLLMTSTKPSLQPTFCAPVKLAMHSLLF